MLVLPEKIIDDSLFFFHKTDDAVLVFLNQFIKHSSNSVIIKLIVDYEILIAKRLYIQLLRIFQKKGAETLNKTSGLFESKALLDVDEIEHSY